MNNPSFFSKLNEALGGKSISQERWNEITSSYSLSSQEIEAREASRKNIEEYGEREAKAEVDNAVKKNVVNDIPFSTPVIETSSGSVIPDVTGVDESSIISGFTCAKDSKDTKPANSPLVESTDTIFEDISFKSELMTKEIEEECKRDQALNFSCKQHSSSNTAYRGTKVKDTTEGAMKDSKKCSKQAESNVIYCKDSCTVNGDILNFKSSIKKVEWGKYFGSDPNRNMANLKMLVTKFIEQSCGSLDNIKNIIVRDNRMILNGTLCPMPKMSKDCIDKLPEIYRDYFTSGAIAPFFDWHKLSKMKKLINLDFDSFDFVEGDVLPDMGWGGAIDLDAPKAFFSNCKSLMRLTIADSYITRDELLKSLEDEKKGKIVLPSLFTKKLNRRSRFKQIYRDTVSKDNTLTNRLFAGKAPNLIGAMDTWRDWQWSTVKGYANNRGNKGFLHYACGTVARVGFAAAITPITFVPRAIKGVANILKGWLSDATTSVTDNELGLSETPTIEDPNSVS